MGRSSTPGEGTRPRVRHDRQPDRDDDSHRSGSGEGRGSAPGGGRRGRGGDGGRPPGPPESGHRRGGPARRSRRSAKRGKRRIFRWISSVLALLILATGAAGYVYYEHLNSQLRKGKRSAGNSGAQKTEPNAAGQTPLNILMIGSDSRNSAANLKLGGSKKSVGAKPLADVQMLLHVSADRKNASVVSIPRDTRVDIPACVDPKSGEEFAATNTLINESLGRGGAGCTLDTWEKITGIYIDHWMMVDFAGVVSMADAIGGAWVCVNDDVYDLPKPRVPGGSGLRLKAGKTKIQGKQALQWLRTRHAFESDFGRAKAQHMYMNAVIRELKSQNAFTDTGRLMNLAETATESLQVSEEIGTVKKLFDLAMQLKNVPLDRLNMLTMPRIPDPLDPDARVLPKPGAADKLWSLLRDDRPLDKKGRDAEAEKLKKEQAKQEAADAPDPAAADALDVTVVNGTGADGVAATQGRAGAIKELLRTKGFTKAESAQEPGSALTTQVTYPKSAGAQGKVDALSLTKALGLPASAVKVSSETDSLTLTVGSDWRTGDAYPKALDDDTDPLEGTEAENAANEEACMDVYWPYRTP
ncbi:LCP family protein [Streptomyces sp. NPDC048560]|uniref:LCP family protein n=1 Tax=Streptomyces sp. NPDC048560 TaxID=3155488 RepID=UPI00341431A4